MSIPWHITAFGAAVVWGIHYPLVDFALKRVSLFGVLLLTVLPVVLFGYILFRHLHLNVSVVIGGLMVMAGAGLIIYHNPS
jgi:hypothetical protein